MTQKTGTPTPPPCRGSENAHPANQLQPITNCKTNNLQNSPFKVWQLCDPSIPCKNHTKPCIPATYFTLSRVP
jgi:hypothetical protein